ncbi:flagellar hook assembly protein FlgD [Chelativorans sp. M5D2P16]|uniref:flagellar hook assembly protein FlgD n=1 Tax=Chelativorans sp. M5D2P16 TaxID=3095678 RepID=UPI002ACA911D|nr:flagellar hook assembly protein FlgD [Chelativorans sp. M5D2P16]MDZ5698463.1 flagellar hook assembly protein FlgD [Chelativorans sp. M5D2P16]
MDVSAVNAATQSQNAAGAPQTVDYQSFLRLLVAQMKNQDPTSPMESTDYVAQLATFSQVEQSVQMNAKLEEILAASSLSQASGLVGREITSADGTVTGVVSEVKLYADGVVAKLEGGEEVIVGPGVVIR